MIDGLPIPIADIHAGDSVEIEIAVQNYWHRLDSDAPAYKHTTVWYTVLAVHPDHGLVILDTPNGPTGVRIGRVLARKAA